VAVELRLLRIFGELVVAALKQAAAAELLELKSFWLITHGPELGLELARGERRIGRREGEVVEIRPAGAGLVGAPAAASYSIAEPACSTVALPLSVGALSLLRAPGLKLRVKSENFGSAMGCSFGKSVGGKITESKPSAVFGGGTRARRFNQLDA